MAITFQTTTPITTSPATLPSYQANDLLLIFGRIVATALPSTPSGYTLIGTTEDPDQEQNVVVYGKIASASETEPTHGFTGAASGDVFMVGVRGVDFTSVAAAVKDLVFTIPASPYFSAGLGPLDVADHDEANSGVIVVGWKLQDWTSVDVLTGDSLTWTEGGDLATTSGADRSVVYDTAIWTAAPTLTTKSFSITGDTNNYWIGAMITFNVGGTVNMQSVSGTLGVLTGALNKRTNKINFTGTVGALTGAITSSLVFLKELDGFVGNLTGGLSRRINKSVTGSLNPIGQAYKLMHVSLAGTLGNLVGTVLRRPLSFSIRKIRMGSGIMNSVKILSGKVIRK